MRREVFLIFKETINNAVRHSGCTSAEVNLRIAERWLILKVSDNGHGIDPAERSQGTGLASMSQRAARLGGHFQIDSTNGNGTRVTLKVPLNHTWASNSLENRQVNTR